MGSTELEIDLGLDISEEELDRGRMSELSATFLCSSNFSLKVSFSGICIGFSGTGGAVISRK